MPTRRIWWLALAAGLLGVLVPACSQTGDQARKAPAGPRRPAQVQQAVAEAARLVQQAAKKPERKPATGPARRHPFRPIRTARAAQGVATTLGTLTLKGIWGPRGDRSAVIQEGERVHFVRTNDRIGHLTVRSIGDGRVVLGAGRRTEILSLYDGPAK